jgi:cytochrome c oxidase subunit 2
MAIAVVIILLVIGSLVFHLLSPWWFTPIASNWGMIDTTVNITFWVTGIVFVLLNLFLAYCILKYRHKKGQKANYEPENKKLETWLTVITSIGVAAMLAPGLIVWNQFVTVPDNAMVVEAVAQQWNWSYRFPGEDGELGEVDPKLIGPDNPFGMSPEDPRGADDILVNEQELHLPINQPVKVLMRSKDVLHNFAVPQFRVKMDIVPGMITYQWFETTRTGKFDLMCEELCGIGHFVMRGRVVVDEQDDFDTWLDAQPTYAETVVNSIVDTNAGQASYAACSACHGANGEGNQMLSSPKLAGLDSAYLERQLHNYKSGIRGSDPADVLGMQMRAMSSTLPTPAAVKNVAAYIASLPNVPAAKTITGNIENGRDTYDTCKVCHGVKGQGIWSMRAPRQAGMNDWYIAAQLNNFKSGLRGGHEMDSFGRQMRQMALTLSDEQEINDLIAYINTL